jgi:glutamate-5-semialdehyde dehydrogenase
VTVQEQAQKARTAALTLSSATRATKDAALLAMADALAKAETAILEANEHDVSRAEASGTSTALIDRLRLSPDRIAGMVEGLRDLAARSSRRRGTRLEQRQRRTGAPGSGAIRRRGDHL